MQQLQNAQYNAPIQEKIFGKMVKAGGKTFFFDVKKASNGNNYLTIAEAYKNQKGERIVNRILLFKEYIPDFTAALEEAKELV